jgi:release factor glutamine methyltransferase
MTVPAAADTQSSISVDAARRDLARELRRRGMDSPELDARLLVGHALGLDHAALAAQANRRITPREAGAIAALAGRRLAHEPMARILGGKEFWGLPLRLNADTLVPRPETETVVEAARDAIDPAAIQSGARIADLGTGSGALLLALLSEWPDARGVGTDISQGALACARENAAALGLAGRSEFVACDFGAALAGPFDLVVSNPPYIARGDIAALPPEVRDHDPFRALDGGSDGLDAYRAIAAGAKRLLAPRGALVVELGAGQADAVGAIMSASGLTPDLPIRQDLAGIARAMVLRPRAMRPPHC